MAHDIRAQLRFLTVSAQKVRLVVDLVRGKNAVQAMEILRFAPQSAAQPVGKAAGISSCQCRGKFRCQP